MGPLKLLLSTLVGRRDIQPCYETLMRLVKYRITMHINLMTLKSIEQERTVNI